MQPIHSENVTWKARTRGVREAQIYSAIHGSDETRIDMIEVPAGGYIPPHRHSSRTEFITILSSAGAQLQIGERIFRPIAGQVFHREPGDILALTNDSQHPFCYSVVRFRYESSDVEYLNAPDEEELEAVAAVPEPSEEVEVDAQEPVAEAGEEPAEDEPSTDEPSEDEEEDSDEDSPEEEAAEEEVAEEPEPEPKPEPKKSKRSGKKSKDGKDSKSSKKKSSKSSKKKK